MTAFQVFASGNKPMSLGNGPIDIIVNDGQAVLTPIDTNRKGSGAGTAHFAADFVKPSLTGRHVLATLSVKAPGKGKYHDYRQLSFRQSTPDKVTQTPVDSTDGMTFDVWYDGKSLPIRLDGPKSSVGVRRGADKITDVFTGNFAIGNVPFTVTVRSAYAEYAVKTVGGRDTFVLAEAKSADNPAVDGAEDDSQDETAPDGAEIVESAEIVNA